MKLKRFAFCVLFIISFFAVKPAIAEEMSCYPERFSFSFGGPVPYCYYRVSLNERKLVYEVKGECSENTAANKNLIQEIVSPNCEQWNSFWKELDAIRAFKWKGQYQDMDILDGWRWQLRIVHGKKDVVSMGFNKNPKNFDRFVKAIETLTGKSIE